MVYNWYGRIENVNPSMVHIFIETVIVDLNTDDNLDENDFTLEIMMHIRGKDNEWHEVYMPGDNEYSIVEVSC